MAGYHYYKQLHSAAIITTGEPNQTVTISGFTSFIYRINVSAVPGAPLSMNVLFITTDALANQISIGGLSGIFNAASYGLAILPVFTNLLIRYTFAGGVGNFTISDEVEAIG